MGVFTSSSTTSTSPGPGKVRTRIPSSRARNRASGRISAERNCTSTPALAGAVMRCTMGWMRLSPSCGSTRKTNFFKSTPSSVKKDDMLCANGVAFLPLAACTMSRISPGARSGFFRLAGVVSVAGSPTRIT